MLVKIELTHKPTALDCETLQTTCSYWGGMRCISGTLQSEVEIEIESNTVEISADFQSGRFYKKHGTINHQGALHYGDSARWFNYGLTRLLNEGFDQPIAGRVFHRLVSTSVKAISIVE